MGVYASSFVFSAWPQFTEHVGTALPRLLIPLAPVALAVTICHLRECLVALPSDRSSLPFIDRRAAVPTPGRSLAD